MRYICLVYFEPDTLRQLSSQERAALDQNSGAYDKKLDAAGHMIVAEALRPSTEAKIIRVREGNTTTVDGPLMQTKEVLGGFILIRAANMQEATQIASGIPLATLGSIEVRPVMVFDTQEAG